MAAQITPADSEQFGLVRAVEVEAALRLGWEFDSHLGKRLCVACAESERKRYESSLPCPDWCNECTGYELGGPSITHICAWRYDGHKVAEVAQVVGPNGQVREVSASFEPLEMPTIEAVRAMARVAGEIADTLERHGLVLTA